MNTKYVWLLAFLFSSYAQANEKINVNNAPIALIQGYVDYCHKIQADETSKSEIILACVNTELALSEFNTLTSYNALLAIITEGEK